MNTRTLTSLELRSAIRDKYAWPGGYCLIFVTSDGAALCADCCRAEYRQIAYSRRYHISDGWRVEGISNGGECDGSVLCDHCSAELGAYPPEPTPAPCERCGSDPAEQIPCLCESLNSGLLIGVKAPSYWAPYLINGDASGLTDKEQRAADRWLDSLADGVEPGGPVDCRPAGFTWRKLADGCAGEAETYYFRAKRDARHSDAQADAAHSPN